MNYYVLVASTAYAMGLPQITRYGEIHSVTYFDYSDLLDRAGQFSFECPAADPNRALLTAVPKREVYCYAPLGGVMTCIGSGIIDSVKLSVDAQNHPTGMLTVSGMNLLGELNNFEVGTTAITDDTGPGQIIALATNWGTAGSVTTKTITHTFSNETVLAALTTLAEEDGGHFFLQSATGRNISFIPGLYGYHPGSITPDVWAFYGIPGSAIGAKTDRCMITSITKTLDTHDYYVGRFYPRGTGFGTSQVTLASGTSVPAYMSSLGYSRGSDGVKGKYLQNDATWAAYGIERYKSYSNVDTSADLLEIAFEELDRQLTEPFEYDLKVVGLESLIHPMDYVHVQANQWVDAYHAIDWDDNFIVLEANNRVDNKGIRTVGMKVSTIDRVILNDLKGLSKMGKNIGMIKSYG